MRNWRSFATSSKPDTMIKLIAAIVYLTLASVAVAASVTSFSPASGTPGTVVTVTGSGFLGATLLQFNANSATAGDFKIVSDTILYTVVPLGATTGPLKVTFGGPTATTSSNFTVAPRITGFNPATGAIGSTVVAIFGANFITNGTTVTFTGASPVAGILAAESQLNVAVPPGTTDGPITVTTRAGTAVSASRFVVSSAPLITDFSPIVGTNGTSVRLDGANFIAGATTVKFGGTAATKVSVSSSSQLYATVPGGAVTGPISVTVGGMTFTTTSNFVFSSGPLVFGFDPKYGKVNDVVTVSGSGLLAVTAVSFSNSIGAYITGQSDSSVQVHVPPSTTTGPLNIWWPGGHYTTGFSFTPLTGPFVTDFSPTLGQVGASVIIDGENFTSATAVKIAGKAASFGVTSDTQITAYVPSGGTNGPIIVTVGAASFATSSNFTVVGSGPYISSFSPAKAVRGQAVTIEGANFINLPVPSVRFGGVPASNAPVAATSQLTAYIPSNDVTGYVTVSNASGKAYSPTMIYMQPWITNRTPAQTWVYSNMTLLGRNLTNATSVTLNGVNCKFSADATQIVVTIPSNATPGPFVVTTPGGVFIDTNPPVFLPKIFGFSPVIGPAGTTVTLTGTGLANVTSIHFPNDNGVFVASPPLSTTPTSVTFNVPFYSIAGPITVVTPNGTDTSTATFLVTQPSEVHFSKTASALTVDPGAQVTYTLNVVNAGPSIITHVQVTDNLPAGLTYKGASSGFGAIRFTNPVVYWTLPALTNGVTASLSIQATASNNLRADNVASITFAEPALGPSDLVATSTVFFVTAKQRTLNVSASNHRLVVTWPANGVLLYLEYSTDLDSPKNWNYVLSGLLSSQGTNYYILTNPPTEFFRLRSP